MKHVLTHIHILNYYLFLQRAASRLVYYWKEKVNIFGDEKAYRRLTIDDLEKEEVAVMEAGGMVPK
jgi:hypothetical protein